MLSDEEKKAIEIQDSILILQNTDLDINNIYSIDLRTYNVAVKTILNLIEKQSKEIEELKEKYSKKLIEFQKEREWYEKDYISKDKIKATIEQLDNEKRQWIEDRDNKHKDSEIIYAIEVLQSPLEKE